MAKPTGVGVVRPQQHRLVVVVLLLLLFLLPLLPLLLVCVPR